jgi:hypothetical protein
MVVCDLGGFDMERHLEEKDCRIANGPNMRAIGSEGGHGYGWNKKRHCFSPQVPARFSDLGREQSQTPRGGSLWAEGALGGTEVIGDTAENENNALEPAGDPIVDYDVPNDIEGVDGTQDSTARTTFPKVRTRLPNYMLDIDKECDDDQDNDFGLDYDDAASSDKDWLPDYRDVVESSEDDFDVDIVHEFMETDSAFAD